MNCAVCGKQFGLWARITRDDKNIVCHACEKIGKEKIESVISSVSSSSNFPSAVELLNATMAQYRIPEAIARADRQRLFDQIFELTARKEKLVPGDIEYLNEITHTWPLPTQPHDSMIQAKTTIMGRATIEFWDPADPPTVTCSGLILQKGEICHWEEAGRLLERRTRRQYVGGSQGISVPLGGGLRYHVSAFRGVPIDTSELADCGPGTLHVTNRRICFAGVQQSAAVEWKKVINLSLFTDGFSIHRTGAAKPTIIQVVQPAMTAQIISLAVPS